MSGGDLAVVVMTVAVPLFLYWMDRVKTKRGGAIVVAAAFLILVPTAHDVGLVYAKYFKALDYERELRDQQIQFLME